MIYAISIIINLTASSDGKEPNQVTVIGATGGSAIFIVLTLLCIIVLLVWCKKHGMKKNQSYNVVIENPASTVKVDNNLSYQVIDKNDNAVQVHGDQSCL